jgi:hypothetical protein
MTGIEGHFAQVDKVDMTILSCVIFVFVVALVIGIIYIMKIRFCPREHYEPVRRIVEVPPPTMRYSKH